MKKPVTFDKAKLDQLKVAYQKALKVEAESFWFEGKEYLVSYARYLIEYLETIL